MGGTRGLLKSVGHRDAGNMVVHTVHHVVSVEAGSGDRGASSMRGPSS